jgi:chromosome segregation ATPase
MSTTNTILDFLGASGFVGAVGAIFATGRLHQKVDNHATQITEMAARVENGSQYAGENKVTLARLEERVRSIKEDLAEIKEAVRKAP